MIFMYLVYYNSQLKYIFFKKNDNKKYRMILTCDWNNWRLDNFNRFKIKFWFNIELFLVFSQTIRELTEKNDGRISKNRNM